MKINKKVLAFILAAILGANASIPALAAENPSSKEEVVYIMTKADGSVENINVVNSFAGGNITDYGEYSHVKMLTTTDEIHQTGDKITFSSTGEKVYYQGTVQDKEIPWQISIRYFLDKKEYSPEEIAGKSGSLEIKISITRNQNCKGTYFDDYALQSTFVLDTNCCSNIRAEGATVANAGSDKQLLYTILPGKGLETSIYAEVRDFEMEAAAINGVKLNLNMEIEEEELTEKVEELMNATKKLDNATKKLSNGTDDLKRGSNSLDEGIYSMEKGVGELDDGITTLQKGIKSLQKGLNTLNSQSPALIKGSRQIKTALKTIQKSLNGVSVSTKQLQNLTTAFGNIKKGIDNLTQGILSLKNNVGYSQYQTAMSENGLDIDSLKKNNQQAIVNCTNQIEDLKEKINALEQQTNHESQVEELKAQVANLENMIRLFQANNGAIGGTESYLNGVSKGIGELYTGAATLKKQYETFDTAISGLAANLNGMVKNMSKLTTGINQLVTNYQTFHKGLKKYTKGTASVVSGNRQLVQGISSLSSGSKKLLRASRKLSSGSSEWYDGMLSLEDGAGSLQEGTGRLNRKVSKMDTQIQEQIDDMLSSIEGEKTETKSFVSEKNTNVVQVQFVIKTAGIEKAEKETEEKEEAETKSLWEKLIQLFDF